MLATDTKSETIKQFKTKLATNEKWATRGLLAIFDKQTADEQYVEATTELNGVGFNGVDAEILSSFAKQVLKGWKLSAKQLAILYKKMPKYASQLYRIAYE
jgi:hypothetical protein